MPGASLPAESDWGGVTLLPLDALPKTLLLSLSWRNLLLEGEIPLEKYLSEGETQLEKYWPSHTGVLHLLPLSRYLFLSPSLSLSHTEAAVVQAV